jgi:hypothetical protein
MCVYFLLVVYYSHRKERVQKSTKRAFVESDNSLDTEESDDDEEQPDMSTVWLFMFLFAVI